MGYERQILSEFSDPEFAAPAALALAVDESRKGRGADAVSLLENFDEKYPASPLAVEAAYQLGVALEHAREVDRARSQFEQLIRTHPDDIFAERSRMQLARILQQKKELKAAVDTLEGITSRRNDDIAAEALIVMGDCYFAQKKYVDALQSYKDVVDQYVDYPLLIERARLGKGAAFEKLHDRTHARAEYQEVAANGLDPAAKKDAADRLRRLKK
jgi:TolA-binding protein